MRGRAWYFGAIGLELTIFAARRERYRLVDYLAGVMDSLDGSAGQSFTFLPIVFEDDCQVVDGKSTFKLARRHGYRLVVNFL